MAERNLIKQIRAIVYEDQANPDRINELLLTYRIGLRGVTMTENEILIMCAADVFGISPNSVIKKSRKREYVYSRQIIWKWLKINKPSMTLTKIAQATKQECHSNVLHGIKSITDVMQFDKDTRQKWERFNQLVNERLILLSLTICSSGFD